MTEPTDDEIAALRSEFGITSNGRGIKEYTQVRDFARAVLAKWGTPPAVAGEPVAWLSTDSIGERYLCFTKPNDSDPVRPLVFGDTTPQPTQAQAGAVPLTDEMVSKAGRALSDLYATECGVDEENNWRVYGSAFIDAAKLVLEAAHGIKQGGRRD